MTYTYDGTFIGFLSVIFETYRLKQAPENIVVESEYQPGLFGSALYVPPQPTHGARVINGIRKRCGDDGKRLVYHVFLSEQPCIEMLLYRLIALIIDSEDTILENFRDPVIRQVHRIERQMHREVHRMHAFIRFQKNKDELYVAFISPDFNVLPLLEPHFRSRYPAMRWLIYDTKRHYGLYYESPSARFVTLEDNTHRIVSEQMLTSDESEYQRLWKTYFESVDIPERRNLKLHLQHVPRRYWKYLVEKQDTKGQFSRN